jgi:hypothetical protein
MTVCIAAACDRATKVVVATDRVLSFAGISADTLPGKLFWIGDWLVLYAGSPSNTAMIVADLHEISKQTPTAENVRQTFSQAYRRRKGRFSSFATLSTYDMTLEQFESQGLKKFGTDEFNRLSQEISQRGQEFNEQLMVIGWGATPNAVMLYELSAWGDSDHHMSGAAAIGSGSEVALSTMLLLGQSRDRSLAQTIYTVAAAKFASEKSTDGDIGRKTCIRVAWKRTDADASSRPPGEFLTEDEINKLYALWDKYGKPRIAPDVYPAVHEILKSHKIAAHVTAEEFNSLIRSSLGQAGSAGSKE